MLLAMGATHRIRGVTASDVEALAGVLARAFLHDPWLTYIFRAPPQRREVRMQRYYAKIIRHGLAFERPVLTTGTAAAVAIWRAPGQFPDSTVQRLRQAVPMIGVVGLGPTCVRALRAEAKSAEHHDPSPHWYLEVLGCDPVVQRGGHGDALVADGLARADADGVPVRLTTQTSDNVAYYRRFGFEVTVEDDVAGGPHVWYLERAPR